MGRPILNFGFLILNVWNSAGGFCGIWCLRQGRWSGEVATSEEAESRRVLQRPTVHQIGNWRAEGERNFEPVGRHVQ